MFSLNPGFIATGLSRHLPLLVRWAMKYIGYFFSKTIEQVGKLIAQHRALVLCCGVTVTFVVPSMQVDAYLKVTLHMLLQA